MGALPSTEIPQSTDRAQDSPLPGSSPRRRSPLPPRWRPGPVQRPASRRHRRRPPPAPKSPRRSRRPCQRWWEHSLRRRLSSATHLDSSEALQPRCRTLR